MDQDQGIDPALGNEPGRNHCLSKSGSRGKDTGVVGEHGLGCCLLVNAQLTLELNVQWRSGEPFIAEHWLDLQIAKKFLDFL